MDNLTHSLVGWTLGQTGPKRKTRKGLAALILGANAPDIDVFFGWVPWAPLSTHRGVTHGLLGGVLVLPILLAGLLWLLDRWQRKRGAEFQSGLPMRFGWLVALSYLGALTHPLLDWQNTYAVQLLSPFDDRWFHNDALFIIDPWIWLGLGLAVWRSLRREAAESPRWRTPAIAALGVLLVYISANAGISLLAKRAAELGALRPRPDVIVANPSPGLFWRRDLIWRERGLISRGTYDPLRSPTALQGVTAPAADGMANLLARSSLGATPEIVDFMRWSILPTAQVRRNGCRAIVSYNDARFADGLARDRFWISAEVPADGRGC